MNAVLKKHVFPVLLALALLFSSYAPAALIASAASVQETENNDDTSVADAISVGDTVDGSISENDREDYFAFRLSSSGRLTIDFTSHMRYFSVYIYDADGKDVWKSENHEWVSTTQTLSDALKVDLESGSYYLKVTGRHDNFGTYCFTLNFESAGANINEPNNSIAEAKTIDFDSQVKGQIAVNDRDDYYAVTLPTSGRLTIDFDSYIQFYSLFLYGGDGKELWSSRGNEWVSSTATRSDTHTIDLEAATYYIKVNGTDYWGGNAYTGNYQFAAAFTPSDANIDEPNNSIADAKTIDFDSQVKGQIAINDREDYYAVTLPSSGRLTIDFDSYIQFYSLFLYGGDGKELWSAQKKEWVSSTATRSDTYIIDLEAATYYIKVNGIGTWDNAYTGNYQFTASFVSAGATVAEPNNSIAQASPISIGQRVNGQIAINDPDDYYKVTLPASSSLSLVVNSYVPSIKVELYTVDGSRLWDTGWIRWIETTEKRGVSFDLYEVLQGASGEYYLRVLMDDCTGLYQICVVNGDPSSYIIDDQIITPSEVPSDPATEPTDPQPADPTEPEPTEPQPADPTEPEPTEPQPTDPIEPEMTLGDLDGDKQITSSDARLALRAAVKLETLDEAKTKAADVDKDNQITTSDARKILRVAVKLDSFDA